MPNKRASKKPTSKNPKLRLNKESLKPVSDAALSSIGGAAPTCLPCPWPSTTNPGCPPPPSCTSSGCY